MVTILAYLFSLSIFMLSLPLGVFVIEVLVACCRPVPRRFATNPSDTMHCELTEAEADARPRCVVLIPAHNESASIASTLKSLRASLRDGDRILVVADNCSDNTATIARSEGAEVVERSDSEKRGKGYALDFGLRTLDSNPYPAVLILDADCKMDRGSIDLLVIKAMQTKRPVQACNLCVAPSGAGPRSTISALAFRFKNLIRPLGLQGLGGPCQLTGTGMAFAWETIRGAKLASGDIVEDMRLGIDLSLAGAAPTFEPNALVTSELPADDRAADAQRTRWEHGSMKAMSHLPRIFAHVWKTGSWPAFMLGLDLITPPLSLLILGLAFTFGLGFVLSVVSWNLGFLMAPIAMGAWLALAFSLGWYRFALEAIPARDLAMIPSYVLSKIPIYSQFAKRPESNWVRTERTATQS